jgi:hypothetical protein
VAGGRQRPRPVPVWMSEALSRSWIDRKSSHPVLWPTETRVRWIVAPRQQFYPDGRGIGVQSCPDGCGSCMCVQFYEAAVADYLHAIVLDPNNHKYVPGPPCVPSHWWSIGL